MTQTMKPIITLKEEHFEESKPSKMMKLEDHSFIKIEGHKSVKTPGLPQFHPNFQQQMKAVALYEYYMNSLKAFPLPMIPFMYNPLSVKRFYHPYANLQVPKPFMSQSGLSTDNSSVKTEDSADDLSTGTRRSDKKKSVRVSACKNYIGLLCAGFSRAILTERNNSILTYTAQLITDRKERFTESKQQSVEQLVEGLRDYIHQNICGKKIKRSNRERDFKIRNSEELGQLLIEQEADSELTLLRKEILREMIDFFFESDCYANWLSKGMISEANRVFFVKNKKELHKKFKNPVHYKPRFDHSQVESFDQI